MKFINNPFEIVIKAVEELYPNTRALIQFNPKIKPHKFLFFRWGCCGYTTFPMPEDYSIDCPIIDISTNIPFEAMVEILAHELAHVVVGKTLEVINGDGHTKEWKEVFSCINKKYYELMKS